MIFLSIPLSPYRPTSRSAVVALTASIERVSSASTLGRLLDFEVLLSFLYLRRCPCSLREDMVLSRKGNSSLAVIPFAHQKDPVVDRGQFLEALRFFPWREGLLD